MMFKNTRPETPNFLFDFLNSTNVVSIKTNLEDVMLLQVPEW